MEEQLQSLLDRIRHEGVERAEKALEQAGRRLQPVGAAQRRYRRRSRHRRLRLGAGQGGRALRRRARGDRSGVSNYLAVIGIVETVSILVLVFTLLALG